MIESLLLQLETLLLYVFGVGALVSAVLMLLLPQPMRVALALISAMVFLGGIYGLLGVHFIAAFQVLIYVGAVMVFMVYVIMLLDPRDPSCSRRFSGLVLPGVLVVLVFLGTLGYGVWRGAPPLSGAPRGSVYGLQQFATSFLHEYWFHFELTSVLLVVAVVAAMAVIQVNRGKHE
jgi:NADH-quinone oxidoreductase subunit J